MISKEKPACFRGTGGAKVHVSSFIFFFLCQKLVKGFREENSFLKKWAEIIGREGRRRDWAKAQSAAIGEGQDSWIRVIQTFLYQKQLLRQEQHGTSWNVFELGFLIGVHYITCALWMLATGNLQKDTARSNALSCLLLKKKKIWAKH